MIVPKFVAAFALASAALSQAQSVNCPAIAESSSPADPQFFDDPQFIVAGVTDNTYRGGHGSDVVLRSSETLTKATAALSDDATGAVKDTHREAGAADERLGHPLEAVQEFQRAAELKPSEPNLFAWAVELLAHRAPAPAAEVFGKGVRLYPQSLRMRLGLASAWYSAGCYESAGRYFFEAADLAPADPTPYLFLTNAQRSEIKDNPGYLDRLARYLKLQPNNALANYYYGVAIWNNAIHSGDPESVQRAQDLLERSTTLDPRSAPAYLELGVIYAHKRQYPQAVLSLRNAISISPNLAEAHYRLSEVYRARGDLGAANQELAVYNRLSTQSGQELERERRDIQQFVISLRGQASQPTKPVQ